jgi:beta-phosphoglucomutase
VLKAVIFDFDGVIANTEPVHMRAFQLTLGEDGITLTEGEYYSNYLAYDDKTLFKTVLKDKKITHDETLIHELMERKSGHYESIIKDNIEILPGVRDFISKLSVRYRLAIGSGALRREIVDILEFAGIDDYFEVIVSAEDVENCKPAPDVFIEVLRRLNASGSNSGVISPDECLVVEDSVSGVEAALSAGMKCLAVTNSYSAEKLSRAHIVKESLNGINSEDLAAFF